MKTSKPIFFEYKQTIQYCVGFIDFMLASKKLTDFASLYITYDFEKNDDIILSYFKD